MELKDKRDAMVTEARTILDRAESEGRDLTEEERQRFDSLTAEIERLSKLAVLDERNRTTSPVAQITANVTGTADEYRSAFMRYLRYDKPALTVEEMRALGEGSGAQGGYLVPTSLSKLIVTKLHELNFVRRLATVIQTDSTTNIPVEDTVAAASWTGEGAAYTETTTTFGQKALGAYKLTCLFKISEELLQDSAFDLEAYLAQRIAGAFSDAEISAFVNGDGSGKPAGIVPAAPVGVTAAANNAIAADELINLYYSLPAPYRPRAVWVMHPNTAAAVRKLKTTDNQYLWGTGLVTGQPELLLGLPVYTTTAMPQIGANNRSVLLADFSYYWVADRGQRQMQRLSELYAANGQVGIRAWERVDGVLTLSDAARVLKHPA